MRSLVRLSVHSAFHWWSAAHCATRILLRCCAAGTNGCLDLRRRAFALDGRLSADWSRCPGSLARRARGSVAPLRRSSAGWMPARIGRLSAGDAGIQPQFERRRWWQGRWGGYEHCGTRHARRTLRLNGPGLGWLFAELLLQHPNRSQQAASVAQRVMSAPCEVTQGVGDTWATCPTLLRGNVGLEQKSRVSLLHLTLSSRLASLLLRWKAADTVLSHKAIDGYSRKIQ